MRWRGRLARLERALGGQVCRDCGQALGGERVFTFAEDPSSAGGLRALPGLWTDPRVHAEDSRR